jgi:IPT/TIG domain
MSGYRSVARFLVVLVGLCLVGAPIVLGSTPAHAAGTAPPWEPDGNAAPPYGNIVFFDANGIPVSKGTNLNSPFAYAVATTAADTGASKAIVNFYNPQHGVLPANWTGTPETGTTTFSPATSLPAGTPATVVHQAPTYPVAASSAASITSWLTQNVPDTTPGYANTIQVRLTDSGFGGKGNAPGTYWETDIAYNNTASAITVDGKSIPANSWAQLFPFVTTTTTALQSSLTSPQNSGTAIPLTAIITPPTAAGKVQFFDGSTALGAPVVVKSGTASFTDARPPAAGSHSYSAIFVAGPPPGKERNPNTATATVVQGSQSNAVVMQINPTVTSISPTELSAGASGKYTIKGSGFKTGATLTFSPTGITASAITVKATTITATLHAVSTAPHTTYTVTVVNTDGSQGSCSACLTVIAAPKPKTIAPSSAAQGTVVSVTITGTAFAAGATVTGPTGVTFSTVVVVSATKITATMTVASTAPTGSALPITVKNDATNGYGKGTTNLLTIT